MRYPFRLPLGRTYSFASFMASRALLRVQTLSLPSILARLIMVKTDRMQVLNKIKKSRTLDRDQRAVY